MNLVFFIYDHKISMMKAEISSFHSFFLVGNWIIISSSELLEIFGL